MKKDTDWRYEKTDLKHYRYFYEILRGLFLVGVGLIIGWVWFSNTEEKLSYIINVFTTGLGFLFSAFIFDVIVRWRGEEREKQALILQMGSSAKDFAVEAVRILRNRGWFTDGTLNEVDLQGYQLKEIDLRNIVIKNSLLAGADLRNTSLEFANFQGSKGWKIEIPGGIQLDGFDLTSPRSMSRQKFVASLLELSVIVVHLEEADVSLANLQGVNFEMARLDGAYLAYTNLQNANLWRANLQNTNLIGAKLQGADLTGADLRGAKSIEFAEFNNKTILPDGKFYSEESNLKKFTDAPT